MSDTLNLELHLGFGPSGVEESGNGGAAERIRLDVLEPRSKRAKIEPSPANVASTPRLAAHQGDDGATKPAWVRAELLARHDLAADLPLHFVQDKVLTKSDIRSDQSRLLIWSSGSMRLCSLLSAAELSQCGLDAIRRRRTKPAHHGQNSAERKRDDKTRYPGVPVLVYERGGAERAASEAELRLNSICSTKAMVINGQGYGRFAAGCGFKQGDLVEVWAFRRPHDQHLCFVIAKRDAHRRTAISRQE